MPNLFKVSSGRCVGHKTPFFDYRLMNRAKVTFSYRLGKLEENVDVSLSRRIKFKRIDTIHAGESVFKPIKKRFQPFRTALGSLIGLKFESKKK